MHSLILSIIMNNDSDFKQSVTMFEFYKESASPEQKKEYEKIVKEEWNREKVSNYSSHSGFWTT